jgi:hypothetical protein
MFTPLIDAYQPTNFISSYNGFKGNFVRLIVSEYRADGSIKRVPMIISRDEFNGLRNELRRTKSIDDSLSVYKKHELIPENIKLEQLQRGMMEKAKKMGFSKGQGNLLLSQNQKKKNPLQNPYSSPVITDKFTKVKGFLGSNFKLHGGLSVFTSYLNVFLFNASFLLPSADAFDLFLSVLGDVYTSNYSFFGWGIFIVIAGFVGYMIDFSPFVLLQPPFDKLIFLPFPLISAVSGFLGYAVFFHASYIKGGPQPRCQL